MVRIVLDCYGGDNSPKSNIDGAVLALSRMQDLELVLTGREDELKKGLEGKGADMRRLEIVHAPEVIEVTEKPTDAIRAKKESSMMKGIRLLREDDSLAGLVSIGSTGALVAAAQLRVGRLKNVIRPTFCPILPKIPGGVVGVCDSGANVDITADHLQQFAIMGSIYLENVYGTKSPRVGLLNIGVEEEKGDQLRKEAFKLLSETKNINFAGNMEARELLAGDFDLVVCDGFSGNVLIKSAEGTALQMMKMIKSKIYSKTVYKIGAGLMKPMFAEIKEFMNYQNYGGSVVLGTRKIIVKGHGSSEGTSVAKCIEQAYQMHQSAINDKIERELPEYIKH